MRLDESTWQLVVAVLPPGDAEPSRRLAIAFVSDQDYAAGRGSAWLWWPGSHGHPAQRCDFDGRIPADCGLLLVISDTALERVCVEGESCMAGLVRRGKIMPFVLRQREELEAAGILEFIETLELATPKH
jgi:hypothetical protein